ncbi:hypothetical protein COV20_06320 [Candidatus Woesearchaeota archaeon CG10_big_fil_rev_8_21_14_0_10_45_16]|nr:MAG: hypothetical protein COV20_06320 [Candidatus Woesearchaeota archaeon CG10_big_fil_rev_8_21_14_0_10_45_16]
MEIKDLTANTGKVDIVAEIVSKEEPRSFEKFGKSGRVCNATLKDATGQVTLTLWNDDVDSVKVGDRIHLQNGWCSEYKGQKQLSAGKFGKIEVVGQQEQQEVMTNDPGMMKGLPGGDSDDGDSDGDSSEEDLDIVNDEEFVE